MIWLPVKRSLPSVSPDHKLLHDETRELYQAALSSLSEKKREVFILSREESLTYKEIARQLNISVNTVRELYVCLPSPGEGKDEIIVFPFQCYHNMNIHFDWVVAFHYGVYSSEAGDEHR